MVNSILVESGGCKGTGLYFNGSCYYFSRRFYQLDFHNAGSECAQLDAKLVSIENEAENKFVSGQMRRWDILFNKVFSKNIASPQKDIFLKLLYEWSNKTLFGFPLTISSKLIDSCNQQGIKIFQ